MATFRIIITKYVLIMTCTLISLAIIGVINGKNGIAEESMLLILDGSGSMWGRVDNKPKISIAKRVLSKAVAEGSKGQSLGLLVYGHRRKGDCSDLELRVPLGGDPLEISRRFQSVMPKGKTPLAASLNMAGELLQGKENVTTIVLVSDGIETCQGDPCEVAAKLRAQGNKVIIHTVGFDVNSGASEQLRCIAQAGGGNYFTANDGPSLEKALKRAQEPVPDPQLEPVRVEEKPIVAQVEKKGPIMSKKIRLAGPGKVVLKPASWVTMAKYWKLVEAETAKERARSSGLETRVKEGEYQVVWRQAEHGYSDVPLTAVIRVKKSKTVELPIDTGIELHVPDGVDKPRWWGLAEIDDSKPLFQFGKSLGPHVVPAGDYNLLWRQSEHSSSTVRLGKVTLEAGKLNKIVADSGVVFQPADWMSKRNPYYIKLIDNKQEVMGQWRVFGAQMVPAGEYTLIFRPTEHGHSDIHWGDVTIEEHGLTNVALDSGVIFLHQKGAKPPYRLYFINLDSNKEIVSQNSWDPLALPPGRYKIDWWETQHNSSRQTLVEEFIMDAGTALELEL